MVEKHTFDIRAPRLDQTQRQDLTIISTEESVGHEATNDGSLTSSSRRGPTSPHQRQAQHRLGSDYGHRRWKPLLRWPSK